MIRQVPPDATFIPGPLDIYTYLMFGFLLLAIIAIFSIIIFILGLPGKIAVQRHHPHANSVKIMGWAGALAVVPWIHAFMWAFHDSITVDVRRFPDEEKKAVDEEIAQLTPPPKHKRVKVEKVKPEAAPAEPAAPEPDPSTTSA